MGNGTDVGLFKFLQEAEVPIHEQIRKKLGHIETIIPLSPIRKRQVIAVRHPDMEDVVRIYVKGAHEYIIDKCTRTFRLDGQRDQMSPDQINYIKSSILHDEFTTHGHRVIMFAYKDMEINEFKQLRAERNNFMTEDDREALESDLCFVAAFALQDDLRYKVERSITFAKRGHINVRMVSGDNLETAK